MKDKQQVLAASVTQTESVGHAPGSLTSPVVRSAIVAPPVSSNVLSFDGGTSRMLFASLTPRHGLSLSDQVQDLLAQLKQVLASHGFEPRDIAKENIFLRGAHTKLETRDLLHAFHSAAMPVTSYILQPPSEGGQAALEILAVRGAEVKIERISEQLTIVRDARCRWAYVGGVEPLDGESDTFAQAVSCFRQLQEHLSGAGFHFNQVVRTWIYERDITAMERSRSGAERQRYQILNDARRQFFETGNNGGPCRFPHDLPPASTGIGMSDGSFVMECLALDVPHGAIEIKPLNNPEQIDAHAYTQEVLKRGAAAIKAAPLFSRGMSICGDYRMLLISGTASIKGQETVHLADPGRQTETTLENIALVLGQAQATLRDIQQVRVYIRNSSKPGELAARAAAIRRVVDATLPRIPKLYLVADVCRDNLLVEIEALSFVKTAPNECSTPASAGEQLTCSTETSNTSAAGADQTGQSGPHSG